MNYLKLSILGLFSFAFLNGFGQMRPEAKRIEKLVASVVKKAMPASVYIIEYDTLKNGIKEGLKENDGFSGVVVSAQGHILTVSHAAATDEVYQISFPDGSKHIAKGLGRMGLEEGGTDHDMAMLKILKPGKWPFAEMGRIADLQLGQPLISISYPGSFYKQIPNIRLGRVTDLDIRDGFIESTTKMETGDSGGPLFDALGRVVGIHSWIKETEEQNFDVPIDFFLKYWTALNVAKDYTKLPEPNQIPFSAGVIIPSIPDLMDLVKRFDKQPKNGVRLMSNRGDQQLSILGTVLEMDDFMGILSKSSMVANQPMLKLGERLIPVQVLARDRENDLVLLKTTEKLANAIKLNSNAKGPELNNNDLGRVLISALNNGAKKVGILSSVYIDMPLDVSIGYFGASAVYADGKITFSRISLGSTGAQFLKANDQVIKINGTAIHKAEEYNREMGRYLAGDSITLDLIREGKSMQVGVYLSGQPTQRHVSFEYAGGRSTRSDGFKGVLVQDAAIKTDECGSPVFDVDGEFYGINIARRSRTSSIIMPLNTLRKFIRNSQGLITSK